MGNSVGRARLGSAVSASVSVIAVGGRVVTGTWEGDGGVGVVCVGIDSWVVHCRV